MGDNCSNTERGKTESRRTSVDIYTILAAIVAAVTVISGYVLFNGLPSFGSDTRRQTRRP